MNTPSLQYLRDYFHIYCIDRNNPADLQPKMKLPCFKESKDASSLTLPNFFLFLKTDSAARALISVKLLMFSSTEQWSWDQIQSSTPRRL